MVITGHPATITKLEDGALRMQELGHDQAVVVDEEQEDFLPHLRNHSPIETPDGAEWLADAMTNGTLTMVRDGS